MAYQRRQLRRGRCSPRFWAALIAACGFAGAAAWVALLVGVPVGWPLAGRWFGPTPAALGYYPDGAAAPPPPRPAPAPAGPLWRQPAFRSLSLAFALGLVAQMGLLTHAVLHHGAGAGGCRARAGR